MNHLITFCSPNGTTRHLAEVIGGRLGELGHAAVLMDLARSESEQAKGLVIQNPEPPSCLWVGSWVYTDHIVPPVKRFIQGLQGQNGLHAVHAKLSSRTHRALKLAALDYQPPEIKEAAAKKSIAAAKAHFPALSVSFDQCNQCGLCAELCPTQTITLDPYPQFGEACFLCSEVMELLQYPLR